MNSDILFSTGQSVLGTVLVAKSERGLCAILLGEGTGDLVRDLAKRFPQASVRHAGAELERIMAKVTTFLAAPALGLDVPLDARGSDFERRVWRALGEIPAGATQTYGAIARRIGVRKDGSLAGYRWGVARKRALLEREARA